MKLIQLNTWSCHLAPAIADLLRRESPDIVCLQEVVSTESTHKILGNIEEVLESVSYEHQYYSPLVQFRFMHHMAQRGNMILSKHPIMASHDIWTHGEFQPDFDRYMHYNAARNVAHAEIATPEGNIHVLTTHGYHLREHKQGNEETLKACRQIASYIDGLQGAVVLTGDFNLTPESESMRVFKGKLRNLTAENNVITTRNYLTAKTEACDYILTRDIETKQFAVLEDIASDHKALMVEF